MKLKIILLFLLVANLIAQDEYSFRVAYGKASPNALGDIISGSFGTHEKDLNVIALDGGYQLKESAFELPMDIYLKGGLSSFNESAVNRDNVYEAIVYIKAYWNFDFWENRVRVGLGEGVSYTSAILYVEEQEAIDKNDNNSYYLNYIDFSIDFDFGRLVNYKPLHGTYIGWALKHRSGIYGLINNVKNGGSNYNTVYLEKSF